MLHVFVSAQVQNGVVKLTFTSENSQVCESKQLLAVGKVLNQSLSEEDDKFPFTFTSASFHFKCHSVQKFWEN